MDVCGAVFLSSCWLILHSADGELDYDSQGQGMQLPGDFSIAGLFPLFRHNGQSMVLPALETCKKGTPNQHGFHLMQAMRFAVAEINNSSGPQPLLPGVKLGYQVYDVCSVTAGILATVDLVEQNYEWSPDSDFNNSEKAVAVVGPDSSSKTFVPAAFLGAYLVPQISYEASNEMLSNQHLYPSFFRTIPSDKNQVAAMLQILVRFNWTWVAILGSDNAYGLEGMRSLSKQAPDHGICISYQGVIPAYSTENIPTMKNVVENLLKTKVNTVVVFSSKTKLKGFFPFVVERNVTGKVWIGTEDWSSSSLISELEGIKNIGTVIGVSIKYGYIPGFVEFERMVTEAALQHHDTQEESQGGNDCLHSTDLYSLARLKFPLQSYDLTSSFNVYKAVYAIAHALHQALHCDSRDCQRRRLFPWELLPLLKQVRFTLGNTSVYFDQYGDPPTGYDIITWVWKGPKWTVEVVGSFSPDPISLTINGSLIDWHTGDSGKVPLSICSPPCPRGFKKLQTGQHTCCFDCSICPTATFLNISDPTTCQPCLPEQWSLPASDQCLSRTVLMLDWHDPISMALLFFLACCVLLISGCALVLLFNLNTPVAKSAGGRTCLVMLAALIAAAMSSLCHFGQPFLLACILKQPLFSFSFTVCLAAITVRSLQVICIFKFASKLPPAYDRWAKKHGPEVTIFLLSVMILVISILRVSLDPPKPSRDLEFYPDSIVVECSKTLSVGSLVELAYVALLSSLCFTFSYMGKDLPANYNEAKCITFSLMVYMISWMSFFTLYLVSRGSFTMAAFVFAKLFSVLAFLGGYFLPKIYIIVLKPEMNTTAHFQNCIQMYTMREQ